MKNSRKIIIGLGIAFALTAILFLVSGIKKKQHRAIFSWKTEAVLDGGRELFALMKQVDADIVYQYISSKTEAALVYAFLEEAQRQEVTPYLLGGEAEWAYEAEHPSYEKLLERVAAYNSNVSPEAGFAGVVYDVEPYTLKEWDEVGKTLMNNYIASMQKVYKKARQFGLSVVACIPYFYDTKGFQAELEQLIASGCDEVAVMNYYKNKEIVHLEWEAVYAKQYEKRLFSIYEFNPAGAYGLTEKNTYYADGVAAAEENYKQLKKYYRRQDVYMALHDAERVKEVIAFE